MVRQKVCSESTKMNAQATVEEARSLAHRLIEYERGKCSGDVDQALWRASSMYGVDEGALRSLRYRWRSLKSVKAHVLERLRQADEWLQERARRERQILIETAETLERAGHPSARLARAAANLVREAEE